MQRARARPDDGTVDEWFAAMHVLAAHGHRREAAGVRARIIEEHRWLVVACARRMQHYQETLDDLVQAGCVGLIRAVDRFDRFHGVPFSAYATATIMGELRHHYRQVWRLRTPRSIQDVLTRIGRARDELTVALRRTPTVDEVAQHVGVSAEVVLEALDASTNLFPLSLDGPDVEGDSAAVAPATDDGIDALETSVTVRAMLAGLPALERQAVFLRYFQDLSQEEIGRRLGLSQVAVSRVVQAAMQQMRGERRRPVRRRTLGVPAPG